MYNPVPFREERRPVLHEAIRRIGFGTLVTFGGEGIEASHLPMLLDPAAGPEGTLYGHLARANPQWRRVAPDIRALAIFLGPNAYVTPSWYPTKALTGKVVPTWNYLTIHAEGRVRFIEDAARLRDHVGTLTRQHEATRSTPWAVEDAPPDYIDAMLGGIVGFELVIEKLEGKWKMSQNRTEADRQGVIDGLAAEPDASSQDVAGIMRDGRPPEAG